MSCRYSESVSVSRSAATSSGLAHGAGPGSRAVRHRAERSALGHHRAARLAGAGKPGPQFGLPPQEQAAFDAEAKRSNLLQEPFLAERPKKGCKPTVTEHESGVVGRSAPNWTAGVACTFRF